MCSFQTNSLEVNNLILFNIGSKHVKLCMADRSVQQILAEQLETEPVICFLTASDALYQMN